MSISIGLGKDYYSLTGDIDLIKNKRRVKSNFRSYGADFDSEEDKIIIPFLTEDNPNDFDDKDEQYKAILKLFEKFNIAFKKSEELQDFVAEIDQENENFKNFSLKANSIRNFPWTKSR
jgi:hypothetical protein